MKIETQGTFADVSPEYAAFVEKFKPRKTTDDCYTPPPVYQAILGWCVERYALPETTAVCRPFQPGGDYERFDYPNGCVVIDNPPFSILSDILRFYNRHGIDYFLFAPALTLFSNGKSERTNFVVCGVQIVYENGAKVPTSFVTSLGGNVIEVRGDVVVAGEPFLAAHVEIGLEDRVVVVLYKAVEAANGTAAQALPKYDYPDDVATAAGLQRISKRGGVFSVPRGDAVFTRRLDMQDKVKESGIFGGGFILSRRAASARAAVERQVRLAEDEGRNFTWRLSDRERLMQDALERGGKCH